MPKIKCSRPSTVSYNFVNHEQNVSSRNSLHTSIDYYNKNSSDYYSQKYTQNLYNFTHLQDKHKLTSINQLDTKKNICTSPRIARKNRFSDNQKSAESYNVDNNINNSNELPKTQRPTFSDGYLNSSNQKVPHMSRKDSGKNKIIDKNQNHLKYESVNKKHKAPPAIDNFQPMVKSKNVKRSLSYSPNNIKTNRIKDNKKEGIKITDLGLCRNNIIPDEINNVAILESDVPNKTELNQSKPNIKKLSKQNDLYNKYLKQEEHIKYNSIQLRQEENTITPKSNKPYNGKTKIRSITDPAIKPNTKSQISSFNNKRQITGNSTVRSSSKTIINSVETSTFQGLEQNKDSIVKQQQNVITNNKTLSKNNNLYMDYLKQEAQIKDNVYVDKYSEYNDVVDSSQPKISFHTNRPKIDNIKSNIKPKAKSFNNKNKKAYTDLSLNGKQTEIKPTSNKRSKSAIQFDKSVKSPNLESSINQYQNKTNKNNNRIINHNMLIKPISKIKNLNKPRVSISKIQTEAKELYLNFLKNEDCNKNKGVYTVKIHEKELNIKSKTNKGNLNKCQEYQTENLSSENMNAIKKTKAYSKHFMEAISDPGIFRKPNTTPTHYTCVPSNLKSPKSYNITKRANSTHNCTQSVKSNKKTDGEQLNYNNNSQNYSTKSGRKLVQSKSNFVKNKIKKEALEPPKFVKYNSKSPSETKSQSFRSRDQTFRRSVSSDAFTNKSKNKFETLSNDMVKVQDQKKDIVRQFNTGKNRYEQIQSATNVNNNRFTENTNAMLDIETESPNDYYDIQTKKSKLQDISSVPSYEKADDLEDILDTDMVFLKSRPKYKNFHITECNNGSKLNEAQTLNIETNSDVKYDLSDEVIKTSNNVAEESGINDFEENKSSLIKKEKSNNADVKPIKSVTRDKYNKYKEQFQVLEQSSQRIYPEEEITNSFHVKTSFIKFENKQESIPHTPQTVSRFPKHERLTNAIISQMGSRNTKVKKSIPVKFTTSVCRTNNANLRIPRRLIQPLISRREPGELSKLNITGKEKVGRENVEKANEKLKEIKTVGNNKKEYKPKSIQKPKSDQKPISTRKPKSAPKPKSSPKPKAVPKPKSAPKPKSPPKPKSVQNPKLTKTIGGKEEHKLEQTTFKTKGNIKNDNKSLKKVTPSQVEMKGKQTGKDNPEKRELENEVVSKEIAENLQKFRAMSTTIPNTVKKLLEYNKKELEGDVYNSSEQEKVENNTTKKSLKLNMKYSNQHDHNIAIENKGEDSIFETEALPESDVSKYMDDTIDNKNKGNLCKPSTSHSINLKKTPPKLSSRQKSKNSLLEKVNIISKSEDLQETDRDKNVEYITDNKNKENISKSSITDSKNLKITSPKHSSESKTINTNTLLEKEDTSQDGDRNKYIEESPDNKNEENVSKSSISHSKNLKITPPTLFSKQKNKNSLLEKENSILKSEILQETDTNKNVEYITDKNKENVSKSSITDSQNLKIVSPKLSSEPKTMNGLLEKEDALQESDINKYMEDIPDNVNEGNVSKSTISYSKNQMESSSTLFSEHKTKNSILENEDSILETEALQESDTSKNIEDITGNKTEENVSTLSISDSKNQKSTSPKLFSEHKTKNSFLEKEDSIWKSEAVLLESDINKYIDDIPDNKNEENVSKSTISHSRNLTKPLSTLPSQPKTKNRSMENEDAILETEILEESDTSKYMEDSRVNENEEHVSKFSTSLLINLKKPSSNLSSEHETKNSLLENENYDIQDNYLNNQNETPTVLEIDHCESYENKEIKNQNCDRNMNTIEESKESISKIDQSTAYPETRTKNTLLERKNIYKTNANNKNKLKADTTDILKQDIQQTENENIVDKNERKTVKSKLYHSNKLRKSLLKPSLNNKSSFLETKTLSKNGQDKKHVHQQNIFKNEIPNILSLNYHEKPRQTFVDLEQKPILLDNFANLITNIEPMLKKLPEPSILDPPIGVFKKIKYSPFKNLNLLKKDVDQIDKDKVKYKSKISYISKLSTRFKTATDVKPAISSDIKDNEEYFEDSQNKANIEDQMIYSKSQSQPLHLQNPPMKLDVEVSKKKEDNELFLDETYEYESEKFIMKKETSSSGIKNKGKKKSDTNIKDPLSVNRNLNKQTKANKVTTMSLKGKKHYRLLTTTSPKQHTSTLKNSDKGKQINLYKAEINETNRTSGESRNCDIKINNLEKNEENLSSVQNSLPLKNTNDISTKTINEIDNDCFNMKNIENSSEYKKKLLSYNPILQIPLTHKNITSLDSTILNTSFNSKPEVKGTSEVLNVESSNELKFNKSETLLSLLESNLEMITKSICEKKSLNVTKHDQTSSDFIKDIETYSYSNIENKPCHKTSLDSLPKITNTAFDHASSLLEDTNETEKELPLFLKDQNRFKVSTSSHCMKETKVDHAKPPPFIGEKKNEVKTPLLFNKEIKITVETPPLYKDEKKNTIDTHLFSKTRNKIDSQISNETKVEKTKLPLYMEKMKSNSQTPLMFKGEKESEAQSSQRETVFQVNNNSTLSKEESKSQVENNIEIKTCSFSHIEKISSLSKSEKETEIAMWEQPKGKKLESGSILDSNDKIKTEDETKMESKPPVNTKSKTETKIEISSAVKADNKMKNETTALDSKGKMQLEFVTSSLKKEDNKINNKTAIVSKDETQSEFGTSLLLKAQKNRNVGPALNYKDKWQIEFGQYSHSNLEHKMKSDTTLGSKDENKLEVGTSSLKKPENKTNINTALDSKYKQQTDFEKSSLQKATVKIKIESSLGSKDEPQMELEISSSRKAEKKIKSETALGSKNKKQIEFGKSSFQKSENNIKSETALGSKNKNKTDLRTAPTQKLEKNIKSEDSTDKKKIEFGKCTSFNKETKDGKSKINDLTKIIIDDMHKSTLKQNYDLSHKSNNYNNDNSETLISETKCGKNIMSKDDNTKSLLQKTNKSKVLDTIYDPKAKYEKTFFLPSNIKIIYSPRNLQEESQLKVNHENQSVNIKKSTHNCSSLSQSDNSNETNNQFLKRTSPYNMNITSNHSEIPNNSNSEIKNIHNLICDHNVELKSKLSASFVDEKENKSSLLQKQESRDAKLKCTKTEIKDINLSRSKLSEKAPTLSGVYSYKIHTKLNTKHLVELHNHSKNEKLIEVLDTSKLKNMKIKTVGSKINNNETIFSRSKSDGNLVESINKGTSSTTICRVCTDENALQDVQMINEMRSKKSFWLNSIFPNNKKRFFKKEGGKLSSVKCNQSIESRESTSKLNDENVESTIPKTEHNLEPNPNYKHLNNRFHTTESNLKLKSIIGLKQNIEYKTTKNETRRKGTKKIYWTESVLPKYQEISSSRKKVGSEDMYNHVLKQIKSESMLKLNTKTLDNFNYKAIDNNITFSKSPTLSNELIKNRPFSTKKTSTPSTEVENENKEDEKIKDVKSKRMLWLESVFQKHKKNLLKRSKKTESIKCNRKSESSHSAEFSNEKKRKEILNPELIKSENILSFKLNKSLALQQKENTQNLLGKLQDKKSLWTETILPTYQDKKIKKQDSNICPNNHITDSSTKINNKIENMKESKILFDRIKNLSSTNTNQTPNDTKSLKSSFIQEEKDKSRDLKMINEINRNPLWIETVLPKPWQETDLKKEVPKELKVQQKTQNFASMKTGSKISVQTINKQNKLEGKQVNLEDHRKQEFATSENITSSQIKGIKPEDIISNENNKRNFQAQSVFFKHQQSRSEKEHLNSNSAFKSEMSFKKSNKIQNDKTKDVLINVTVTTPLTENTIQNTPLNTSQECTDLQTFQSNINIKISEQPTPFINNINDNTTIEETKNKNLFWIQCDLPKCNEITNEILKKDQAFESKWSGSSLLLSNFSNKEDHESQGKNTPITVVKSVDIALYSDEIKTKLSTESIIIGDQGVNKAKRNVVIFERNMQQSALSHALKSLNNTLSTDKSKIDKEIKPYVVVLDDVARLNKKEKSNETQTTISTTKQHSALDNRIHNEFKTEKPKIIRPSTANDAIFLEKYRANKNINLSDSDALTPKTKQLLVKHNKSIGKIDVALAKLKVNEDDALVLESAFLVLQGDGHTHKLHESKLRSMLTQSANEAQIAGEIEIACKKKKGNEENIYKLNILEYRHNITSLLKDPTIVLSSNKVQNQLIQHVVRAKSLINKYVKDKPELQPLDKKTRPMKEYNDGEGSKLSLKKTKAETLYPNSEKHMNLLKDNEKRHKVIKNQDSKSRRKSSYYFQYMKNKKYGVGKNNKTVNSTTTKLNNIINDVKKTVNVTINDHHEKPRYLKLTPKNIKRVTENIEFEKESIKMIKAPAATQDDKKTKGMKNRECFLNEMLLTRKPPIIVIDKIKAVDIKNLIKEVEVPSVPSSEISKSKYHSKIDNYPLENDKRSKTYYPLVIINIKTVKLEELSSESQRFPVVNDVLNYTFGNTNIEIDVIKRKKKVAGKIGEDVPPSNYGE